MTESATRILLVDDEPNILIALEFLFEQEGYLVQKAFDGVQALDKLTSFNPNIIVLDVMMPGLDGFEVAKRIRMMDGFDDVRIIFLTAKGTQQDKRNGYGSGGEVYLTKPFDNEELVRTVNEVVEFG
ncbi:MAG: response regulator [Saprospiraceae bacterium]|nr:response regulator [Saprospiraceae bacterium]